MKDELDLSRLTAAEELLLWRYRRRAKNGRLLGRTGPLRSQAEMAEELGISQQAYSRLEGGFAAQLSADQVKNLLQTLVVRTLHPSLAELCLIARRRSGLELSYVERQLQVSRPYLHRLERSADPTLVQFWRRRGYSFPDDAPGGAGWPPGHPYHVPPREASAA